MPHHLIGGGEDAAIDSAQDNDGHQQPPKRVFEGAPDRCPAHPLVGWPQIFAPGLPLYHQNQGQPHENAGDDAGYKDLAYGYAGQRGVDYEGNAGGNDNGDGGRRGDDAGGKGRAELLPLDHSGDQNHAERRHSGRAGAGYGAEKASHDNAHHGNSPAQMAQQGVNDRDQPLRDAGPGHNVAGKHEKGDGQQQIFADAAVNVRGHQGEACPVIDQGQETGQSQRQGDGRAQDQQKEKHAEHDEVGHTSAPPLSAGIFHLQIQSSKCSRA